MYVCVYNYKLINYIMNGKVKVQGVMRVYE